MRPKTFALERFFASREFVAPHNLCASDGESLTIGELLALEPGAAEAFAELSLGYTQTAGDPGLRAEVAALYTTLAPENVLIHAGGEEVIFTFMNAALAPGDHVIVHHPSYQALVELPRAIGCDVTLWQTTAESGWALDLDELRRSLRPATRVIVVNLPHSPTGYLMSHEEWVELVRIARDAGAVLFADEAYRGLEYRDGDRLPAACDLDPNACSLGLVSKGYGLPGLRIGWLATRNERLLDEVAKVKDYTTICSSAPSEFLGRIALRHTDELLARTRATVAYNLDLVRAFFARHTERFAWVPPKAGPVTYPTYLGAEGVDDFCRVVLERAGVLLLPGTVFTRPSREFRMGLGRQGMAEGLDRLDAFLFD